MAHEGSAAGMVRNLCLCESCVRSCVKARSHWLSRVGEHRGGSDAQHTDGAWWAHAQEAAAAAPGMRRTTEPSASTRCQERFRPGGCVPTTDLVILVEPKPD